MKKIAILVENYYEDMELMYPYYRLKEQGYIVDLLGSEKDIVYKGKHGYPIKSDYSTREVDAKDYDGVIIPGGYSPDHMRRHEATIDFVEKMDEAKKPIAAICHGPWMMASCCDIKGKRMTSFFSIKDDIINAGAEFVDEEVVVDGHLITSRTPDDLIAFVREFIVAIG